MAEPGSPGPQACSSPPGPEGSPSARPTAAVEVTWQAEIMSLLSTTSGGLGRRPAPPARAQDISSSRWQLCAGGHAGAAPLTKIANQYPPVHVQMDRPATGCVVPVCSISFAAGTSCLFAHCLSGSPWNCIHLFQKKARLRVRRSMVVRHRPPQVKNGAPPSSAATGMMQGPLCPQLPELSVMTWR